MLIKGLDIAGYSDCHGNSPSAKKSTDVIAPSLAKHSKSLSRRTPYLAWRTAALCLFNENFGAFGGYVWNANHNQSYNRQDDKARAYRTGYENR
jgi:hypothetical protein